MSKAELEKKVETLREDLRTLRFKAQGTKTKNVKEMASLKKQIARILTAQRQAK